MKTYTESMLDKNRTALELLRKATKEFYGKPVKHKKIDSIIGNKFTYTLINGITAIVDVETGDTNFFD